MNHHLSESNPRFGKQKVFCYTSFYNAVPQQSNLIFKLKNMLIHQRLQSKAKLILPEKRNQFTA